MPPAQENSIENHNRGEAYLTSNPKSHASAADAPFLLPCFSRLCPAVTIGEVLYDDVDPDGLETGAITAGIATIAHT